MKLIIEAVPIEDRPNYYKFKISHEGGVNEEFNFDVLQIPYSKQVIDTHFLLFLNMLRENANGIS